MLTMQELLSARHFPIVHADTRARRPRHNTRRLILYRSIVPTCHTFFVLKRIGLTTMLAYYLTDSKNMQVVLDRLRNPEVASTRAERLRVADLLTRTVMRAAERATFYRCISTIDDEEQSC